MDVPLHFQKGVKRIPSGSEDISKSISDIGSRLRVLEERYLNLRKKMQVTDQNLIDTEKEHMKEVRELNNRILDMTQSISDIHEKITVMLGELTNCVRQEDFKTLKKYVELWQPANFITKQEVDNILKTNTFINDAG